MRLRLGLDIGSTTVKAVVLRDDEILFTDYRRHQASVRTELSALLAELGERFGDQVFQTAVTGSGGLQVAQLMGVDFVQEVIAGTKAIQQFHPDTDVVIELGGEDAKITFLKPTPEQRMNGTCAGGTGAFIDQMATLLHTDAAGLDELAARYQTLYPIASRCGVFAKTDLQPLINQGAAPEDLAASVFQAVATQTIAGLACGHPVRGNVVFLGGPLHFLPQLRQAFVRLLGEKVDGFETPADAHLFVALGAALGAAGKAFTAAQLLDGLARATSLPVLSGRMQPLFTSEREYQAFQARHAHHTVAQRRLATAQGDCFLGIDAGSTTIKAVLIDDADEIVYSFYSSNRGDPVGMGVEILKDIYAKLPAGARIASSCVTGYGESLTKAALRVDAGEIETMAHYRAARKLAADVSAIIDIGGQDMKFLKIKDHAVDSIAVNEACSSGCGSFLQTFAQTMGMEITEFAKAALLAEQPVDLGSRCTVFMNSSVKQAQKEGATVGEIAAGLSYSVIKNALFKVIKLKDTASLGPTVVVQGGTFLNDAVLRAFELLTGAQVIRPNIAGLMGAYGAALSAKWRHTERPAASTLRSLAELEAFSVSTGFDTCPHCQNHCKLTISTFSDGSRHVTGNRCEKGESLDAKPQPSTIPNLYAYKYKRLFSYRRLTEAKATRGDIGIPRVLNMYENYPFWFTVLTTLGFRVMLSPRSSHDLFEKGMESIPSENVCYPAKLVHGHIEALLEQGVKTIFFPCVSFETKEIAAADNHFNCPIVALYPQVAQNNITALRAPGVRFLRPFLNLNNRERLVDRLAQVFATDGVTMAEARAAIEAGFAEDAKFKADVRAETERALALMRERGLRGVVLAGRPYHLDPEINHGIPEVINGLGMAVFTEDSLAGTGELPRPLRVRDQWVYHTRLYEAAARVGAEPDLSLVQLNSFGCGVDAITTDQVQEILERAQDTYTLLKIDEVSNLGAARIRLRSLQAANAERAELGAQRSLTALPVLANNESFTKEMRARHTLFAPQMSPIHFRLIAPVFRKLGYNVKVLERVVDDDVQCGLKFVNNDACYPAVMVIGQLINNFISGGANPDESTVVITQTGGMCRASNYAALLRKGLADAGYPQVPVLALSAQGLESHPGFKITGEMVVQGIRALILGDLFQTVLFRVRPYEVIPGSAMQLYYRWNGICAEWFEHDHYSPTLKRKLSFKSLVRQLVQEFDELPLLNVPRKPRVGVVGEILVKFHPDANNHVISVIEEEGCEAVVPGMLDFFTQAMHTGDWRWENLGIGKWSRYTKRMGNWLFEKLQHPVNEALDASRRFRSPTPLHELAEKATKIISLGTAAGEGWLLTAEMIDLIEQGAPNVICAQPFACLPNHVVGRGMFAALRREYPQANVVSVDYDPGASEVNQLNRIKLMISNAFAAEPAMAVPLSTRTRNDNSEPL
ncbi:MAG: acyl-CoA dehydratase activase-related protein [Propionibacteriaceae bacterium]|jgi:predicted CoA-substrate-specific enzyme activase|nr:acyl-CoA dehydratase activase-related protein [Propionibacteriaceae bacterium]